MKVINRIKSNQQFGEIIKKGQTIKNTHYVIHYLKNDLSHTRVGISVSSKLGHAVIRNKIKRQLRAMCDSLIDYNKTENDIVIIVKNPFLNNDFSENKQKLQDLLTKIGSKE